MKVFIPLSLDSPVTTDHPIYPLKLLYVNTIQNEFVHAQTSSIISEKVQILKYKLINYLFLIWSILCS